MAPGRAPAVRELTIQPKIQLANESQLGCKVDNFPNGIEGSRLDHHGIAGTQWRDKRLITGLQILLDINGDDFFLGTRLGDSGFAVIEGGARGADRLRHAGRDCGAANQLDRFDLRVFDRTAGKRDERNEIGFGWHHKLSGLANKTPNIDFHEEFVGLTQIVLRTLVGCGAEIIRLLCLIGAGQEKTNCGDEQPGCPAIETWHLNHP